MTNSTPDLDAIRKRATTNDIDEAADTDDLIRACDVAMMDRNVLLAEVDRLTADLRSSMLCLKIQTEPWIAGPPAPDGLGEELDSDDDAVRFRAGYLRIAMWTFGYLASLHPAPNHLAMTYDFPDELPGDMPDEMRRLVGYSLEIAAVKPGGKGPSRMRVDAEAEIARLTTALATAKDEERAVVVAWLRDSADNASGMGWNSKSGALRESADAIESNRHREKA